MLEVELSLLEVKPLTSREQAWSLLRVKGWCYWPDEMPRERVANYASESSPTPSVLGRLHTTHPSYSELR